MATQPITAALLSALAPGLGQLANGKQAKGVSLLCMTLGVWVLWALACWGPPGFRSSFTAWILGLTYLGVWWPAVRDAFHGDPEASASVLSGDRTWYLILMVFVIGALAVPLIWQSRRLSTRAKYAWSAIGILNTVLALVFVAFLGPALERSLGDAGSLLNSLP